MHIKRQKQNKTNKQKITKLEDTEQAYESDMAGLLELTEQNFF